jgi:hypothetical protein
MTLRYQPQQSGYDTPETFERVVVMGWEHVSAGVVYRAVHAESGRALEVARGDEIVGGFSHETLVFRNPQTSTTQAWTLTLHEA